MSVAVGGSGEGSTEAAVDNAVDIDGSGDGRTGVVVSGMDVKVGGSGVGEGKIVSELALSVASVPAVFVGITVGKEVCDGSAATTGGGAFRLLAIRTTAMITTTITVPKTSSGK